MVVVGNFRKGFLGGWGWAEMMGEELILTQKSCRVVEGLLIPRSPGKVI